MPPCGQHVKRSRAGRGGLLRAPERRCWSPERWPNHLLEYADPRSVHPAVSPAETGKELPPGLLRGPKRDSAPGEPSPPVCSGGAKEPGARAPSAETCRAPTGGVLTDGYGPFRLLGLGEGGLVLETPQGRTLFFTGGCAALSRFFNS